MPLNESLNGLTLTRDALGVLQLNGISIRAISSSDFEKLEALANEKQREISGNEIMANRLDKVIASDEFKSLSLECQLRIEMTRDYLRLSQQPEPVVGELECECDEISNGETCIKCGPSSDQPVEYPHITDKWKEVKPSLEAQKIRSALLHVLDSTDFMPDYVVEVVDVAIQLGMNAPKRESIADMAKRKGYSKTPQAMADEEKRRQEKLDACDCWMLGADNTAHCKTCNPTEIEGGIK